MSKIVLIHPDAKLAAIYQRHLEPHFNVDSAHDGLTGLRLIKHSKPRLIISDLDLPYMSGLALLEYVRNHPEMYNTPFVFLSNSAMPHDALNLGASAWLNQKEHAPEHLLPHIIQSFRMHYR